MRWPSTHSHFILQPAFNLTKKKCVNRERPCQDNWFQKFPLPHYGARLVRLFGTGGATERCSRQKLAKYLRWKRLIFSKVSGWITAAFLKLNFFIGIYFAITACFFSFYFQNLKSAFFKWFLPVVASAGMYVFMYLLVCLFVCLFVYLFICLMRYLQSIERIVIG